MDVDFWSLYVCVANPPDDINKLFKKMSRETMGVAQQEGTNFPATFGHIMCGGYDAQYYGYLWAEVIAADVFSFMFAGEGMYISPEAGVYYRRCVLSKGGTKDAKDMLRELMRREPNWEAFLKLRGVNMNP